MMSVFKGFFLLQYGKDLSYLNIYSVYGNVFSMIKMILVTDRKISV